MPKRGLLIGLLLLITFATTAHTQEESLDELLQGFEDVHRETNDDAQSVERLLEGFEDDTLSAEPQAAPQQVKHSSTVYTGMLSFSSSYNTQHKAPAEGETDYRGFSRARFKALGKAKTQWSPQWQSEINLSAFYDAVYQLRGRDNYTDEVLDEYESEVDLRDTFVQGTLTDSVDIKVGRQIVVWGKADSIRVVDILNPLDLREPGMVDIEDLRLPVGMAKLDYYLGSGFGSGLDSGVDAWNASLMLIPEVRFSKQPAYGSDFYVAPTRLPPEEHIASRTEHLQYAAALSGRFTGWDISLHYADIYSNTTYQSTDANGAPVRKHPRVTLWGAAANATSGNWLYKGELALLDGLRYSSLPEEQFRRADALLGLEYYGFTDTTLGVEIADRYILNYDEALNSSANGIQKEESQLALRYTGKFLREKLELGFLSSLWGPGDGGGFYRAWAEYELSAGLLLSGGMVVYQSGDNPMFKRIARNDRLFAELEYYY